MSFPGVSWEESQILRGISSQIHMMEFQKASLLTGVSYLHNVKRAFLQNFSRI
jgi:hypothetical protein